MRTKFKAWAEPYINEHPEVMLDLSNASNLDNLYLEIGSGKGDFIIGMAEKYPDISFIGVERNVTCAGITAKKLVEKEVKNAKLSWIDALELLPMLKEESINTLFLNFSDPWPKKRHVKRRLTSETFLSDYFRTLKNDGKLIFKTDNKDLFDYTLESLNSHNFKIIEVDLNYLGDDDFDMVTEYERKFRELGQPIYKVVVMKNA